MVLKDRKTGGVYELNIVNVVVECDIIYVSILYNLYRICKAGQFAGIYSPCKVYIYFESSTAGRCEENILTADGRVVDRP